MNRMDVDRSKVSPMMAHYLDTITFLINNIGNTVTIPIKLENEIVKDKIINVAKTVFIVL